MFCIGATVREQPEKKDSHEDTKALNKNRKPRQARAIFGIIRDYTIRIVNSHSQCDGTG